MKVSSTTKIARAIKYNLRESMTTEELYELMISQWTAELPGKFQLKKGLFGSHIRFDTYMTMQPRIKVKNNVLKITPVTVQSKMGGIDFKSAAQAIGAIKEGRSIVEVALSSPEYFLKVCAEVEKLLAEKIVS